MNKQFIAGFKRQEKRGVSFASVIYEDNCQGKRESLWANLISCSSLHRGSPWWVERESKTSERGEREIAEEKTKEKSRGKIVMKFWSKRTDGQHPNSVHAKHRCQTEPK
jgi:hypothetical protein